MVRLVARIGIAVPAALAVGVLCQGCLLWTGATHRAAVAKHPGQGLELVVRQAPRIRWSIEHDYRRNEGGDAVTAIPGAQTHTYFKRAFQILQPAIPFLAKAALDEPDPEYLLVLETTVDRRDSPSEELALLTLGVVPSFERREYRVRATLRTVEGADLISHASSTELRGVLHLLMLPLFPWILTHQPGYERFFDPMRSALAAVADDFASLPRDRFAKLPSSAATRAPTE